MTLSKTHDSCVYMTISQSGHRYCEAWGTWINFDDQAWCPQWCSSKGKEAADD